MWANLEKKVCCSLPTALGLSTNASKRGCRLIELGAS